MYVGRYIQKLLETFILREFMRVALIAPYSGYLSECDQCTLQEEDTWHQLISLYPLISCCVLVFRIL